jgi:hypothetical protein
MCEQCLFEDLIKRNVKQPDPRVGSTPALAAYSAACAAPDVNITIPAGVAALKLPSDWCVPTDVIPMSKNNSITASQERSRL